MSKNWTFKKIIGLELNFTYEFEVCYVYMAYREDIQVWNKKYWVNVSHFSHSTIMSKNVSWCEVLRS